MTKTRPTRSADGTERWDTLIAKSVELFHAQGYAATSLSDIAEASGMVKATVYHYIAAKEDLLFEICRRALEERSASLVEPAEMTTAPGAERMRAFFVRWLHAARNAGKLNEVADREYIRLSARQYRAVKSQREQYARMAQSLIEAGIADGSLGSWVRPELAVDAFFALLRTALSRCRGTSNAQRNVTVEWYAHLLIHSMAHQCPVDHESSR